jgi:hypothetical protein
MQVDRELAAAEAAAASSFSTCITDSHLQRVTIRDAVLVQFYFLMMSKTLLETCRGL